ncbi:MAG: TolC family protein [Bacteroidales bacterium]
MKTNFLFFKFLSGFLYFCLSSFSFSTLIAQDKAFDLQDCLKMAVERNLDLRTSFLNKEKSLSKSALSKSYLLPQISFKAKFTDNIELPPTTVPGDLFGKPGQLLDFRFGTQYGANLGFDLEQQVLNFSLAESYKISKSMTEISETQFQILRDDLIHSVGQSYYKIQMIESKVEMNNHQIRLMDSLIQIVVSRIRRGDALHVDSMKLVVERNIYAASRQNALYELQEVKKQMYNLLDWPEDTVLNFQQETFRKDSLPLLSYDKNNLKNLILIEQKKNVASRALQMSKLGRLPTMYAFAHMGIQNMHDKFHDFINGSWDYAVAVGIGIQVPLFYGSQLNKQTSIRKIELFQNELQLKKNYKLSKNNFDIALAQLMAYQASLKGQKDNFALSKEVLDIVKQRYLQGITTISDLLTTQNSYNNAYLNFLQAYFAYKIAELDVFKASGNLEKLLKE